MKVTYNLKNKGKNLPIICRIGLTIFYIGILLFLAYYISIFEALNITIKNDSLFPLYCFLLSGVGLIITIIFDKDRKEKTNINVYK